VQEQYVDLKGALVTPTGVLKATSWNGPAIFPRGNHPRSPPFFPDGHSEYSWATCEIGEIISLKSHKQLKRRIFLSQDQLWFLISYFSFLPTNWHTFSLREGELEFPTVSKCQSMDEDQIQYNSKS
jgi:hypothetical protein